MCDLYHFLAGVTVASYTDDTTPYSVNKTHDLVTKEKPFSEVLLKWFDFNYMKINSGKSHEIFSGNDNVSANIKDHIIISENFGFWLFWKFDYFGFKTLFWMSYKQPPLGRVAPYMCLENRKAVMKDNIAPEIMKELFASKMGPYDLRNSNSFKRRRVNSVWHGTESVSKNMGFST